MRRALVVLALAFGCGGSSPPVPPLVVADSDAGAVTPPSRSSTPAPDAADPTTITIRECGSSSNAQATDDLQQALAETTKLAEAGALKDQARIDAVWTCFVRFRPTQAKSIRLVKDIHAAVLAVKDPSYGPKAVAKIAVQVADPKDPAQAMDEIQFWQATSVRLIGDLRYTAGVRALVTVLLDEKKQDLTFPVRSALAKMPKEAEPLLVAVLAGSDPDFAKLAAKSIEARYLARVSDVLAAIGRSTGRDAVLDALAKVADDQNRTILALQLTRFPASPRSQKAFLDAYAKVPPNAVIVTLGGANAHAALAGGAAGFFDPTMTEWLLRENAAAKGEAADAMPMAALPSAIKLMTQGNAKNVAAAVNEIPGQAIEKDMFKSALPVLDACKKDVACYLKELAKPVPSSPPAAKMGHVKAAWMAAIYADATTRAALVDRLAAVKDGSVRLAVAEAIAHLAPNGDAAAADEIDGLVAAEKSAGNMSPIDELAQLALRLRARAL